MPRSHPLAHSLSALLLATLALASSRTATADPWQPLEVGRRWEYRGVGGAHQVETITGDLMLRGRSVAAKYYAEGPDAGLENYWMLGADGTVFLCGFNAPSAALAVAYEPPIPYLPGPPALGASRTTSVTAYRIADGSVLDALTLTCTVLEEVDLSLPAGLFHALGAGQVLVAPQAIQAGGRTFSLDGRMLTGVAPGLAASATDWYSDGIGIVQYQTIDLYQLVGFGLPTSAGRSTWSAIKRLYH
jgi:hypothetical protein